MSESAEKITVACACGKKLKAPRTAVGRKAKCPACGNVVMIELPKLSDDDPLAGLYEMAAAEEQAATAQSDGPSCPGCGAVLDAGAVLCVNCGMDLRSKKRVGATAPAPAAAKPAKTSKRPGKAPSALSAAAAMPAGPVLGGGGRFEVYTPPEDKGWQAEPGRLVPGIVVSILLGLFASAMWLMVIVMQRLDYPYLHMLVGIAAGLGMLMGQKGFSAKGGISAAIIAVAIMVGSRVTYLQGVVEPEKVAVVQRAEVVKVETQVFNEDAKKREKVIHALVVKLARDRDQNWQDYSTEVINGVRSGAAPKMGAMSDAERDEAILMGHDLESRFALDPVILEEMAKEKNKDLMELSYGQTIELSREARKKVNAMTNEERAALMEKHGLKTYTQIKDEAEAKAAAEHEAELKANPPPPPPPPEPDEKKPKKDPLFGSWSLIWMFVSMALAFFLAAGVKSK